MNKTTNLIDLIGEFLSARNTVVIEEKKSDQSGVTVDGKQVIFDLSSMQIRYEDCDQEIEKEEIEFLYNILNVHLKSLEAVETEDNCLSAVSNHELKNILSSAKLSLEMLSTYDFDKDDRTKLLSQAFNAVSQSVSLFDEMVLMEKLQHQQRSKGVEIALIDVGPIIESILTTLTSDIRHKGLKVEVVNESEGLHINGSAFWIERALFNLVSNAVKYNKQDGHLRIKLHDDKKYLYISVSDSGIGIKSSEQEKVMEKFQTSASTQNQGTGVGLALVKAISDAHEGRLELESVYDEGSTFTLVLPKKISNNKIAHPIAVMNAAAILLLVGVSYLFPVIPSFGNIETASAFDTIKLDHGSTIKLKKGAEYSFWDLHNLTGEKYYRRLNLESGEAEADLHQVHVAFNTPTASFTNLGTELAFGQKPGKGVVSVYKGELAVAEQHVYEGEGFASTAAGIKVVELLDPPYGLSEESEREGELVVTFNAVEGAKKYRATLASDAAFSNIVSIKESSETRVRYKIEKDGFYHIKIAALDENEILGLPNTALVANSYHLQQGIIARDSGAYAKAELLLKQSIKEFGGHNQEPYSALAWNYYLQQKYAPAVRFYKQAIAIRDNEGDQVHLARTYYHLKEYTKADAIYKKLLKQNSNSLDALWGEAEILIANNDYIKAKGLLEKLLRLDRGYPLANYDMARVMFLMKNKEAGLRYLKKERHFNPDNKDLVDDLAAQVKKGSA